MKKLMLCLVALAALFVPTLYAQSAAAPAPGDLSGNWQGTIKAGGKDVRIVVKIAKADKAWTATLFNADQASQSLSASSVSLDGPTFKFKIDLMSANYEGKLDASGKSMAGTWTQGTQTLPLTLVRATPETAWDIPEPPKPPTPMAADADPSFDVATIKPNPSGETHIQALTLNGRNFAIRNGSLGDLITFAYDVHMQQIVNGPSWMNGDRYDIAAVPDKPGTPSVDQMRIMVRKLLADRYKLSIHHEKKDLAAYVLTVDKGAPKLAPNQSGGQVPGMGMSPGDGGVTMRITNASISDFTSYLQMVVMDHPVVDQTGIKGRFDFKVTFTPDDSQFNGHPPKGRASDVSEAPKLSDAIQQQLGLKLAAEKTAVDVIAIDHVEKPSPN